MVSSGAEYLCVIKLTEAVLANRACYHHPCGLRVRYGIIPCVLSTLVESVSDLLITF